VVAVFVSFTRSVFTEDPAGAELLTMTKKICHVSGAMFAVDIRTNAFVDDKNKDF
jgi:hypothetical protein